MANRVELDLTSNPDLAPLKSKEAGHPCELHVTLDVESNDGKKLVGTITEVELGDDYDDATDAATVPAEKPAAVAVLTGKK